MTTLIKDDWNALTKNHPELFEDTVCEASRVFESVIQYYLQKIRERTMGPDYDNWRKEIDGTLDLIRPKVKVSVDINTNQTTFSG